MRNADWEEVSRSLLRGHPPRATNPRTGGRPTRELAGGHPENWQAAVLFNLDTGGCLSGETSNAA